MGKDQRSAADPIYASRPEETFCPDCGGAVRGGVAGCRKRFEELQARNHRMGSIGLLRMCVDAYCLQHPEPYMHSTKSETGHLASICWQLEYAASPAIWQKIQKHLNDRQDEPRLAVPATKGKITIADVFSIQDAAAYQAKVREWAESAWQAWSQHHATVRSWVSYAIGES